MAQIQHQGLDRKPSTPAAEQRSARVLPMTPQVTQRQEVGKAMQLRRDDEMAKNFPNGIPQRINTLQRKPESNAQGLPPTVQPKMEAALNADLSSVRVHTNSAQAKELNAQAFTQGEDVHFAPGKYDPQSQQGQELIGHEMAHVKQQREGRVQATRQMKGMGVNDDSGLEREADDLGKKAARGEVGSGSQSQQGVENGAIVQRKSASGNVVQLKEVGTYGDWFDDTNKLQQDGTARGAEMKVRFKPNMKVDAKLIGMVQSVRTIHNGASFFPNNDAFYKGRAIQKDKAIEVNSVSKETDEGTRIDQSKTNRNPLYAPEGAPDTDTSLDQTLPDSDVTKSNGFGKHGFRYDENGASKEQDAELEDSPMIRSVDMSKNSGQVFETTALAIKGTQKDTYYGSVQWGWRTDASGGFTKIPFKVVSEGMPSSTFLKSAESWNASKTSAGKETLDLPVETVFSNAAPISLFSDAEMKTKTKDLPAKTRMVNTACTIHGSYKMRIVDGPEIGTEGYVDQTKIQRER